MIALNTTVSSKPFVTCYRCHGFNSFTLDKPMKVLEILTTYHSGWAVTEDGYVCPSCQGTIVHLKDPRWMSLKYGDIVVIDGVKYTVEIVLGTMFRITAIGITRNYDEDSVVDYDMSGLFDEELQMLDIALSYKP